METSSKSAFWIFLDLVILAAVIIGSVIVAFGPWWQGHPLEAASRTGIMSDWRSPTGSEVDSFAQRKMTAEIAHEEQLILVDVSKWELRSWRRDNGAIVTKKLPLGDVFSSFVRGEALSLDGKWLAFVTSFENLTALPSWLWFLDLESGSPTLAAAWIPDDAEKHLSWLPNGAAVLVNQYTLTPKQKVLFASSAVDIASAQGEEAGKRFESQMLSLGHIGPALALVAIPPGGSTKLLECDLDNLEGSPVAVWRDKVAYIRGDRTDIAVNPTPTTLCCYDMQTRENVSLMQIGHQSAPLCWSRDGHLLLFGVWEWQTGESRHWLAVCDLDGRWKRLSAFPRHQRGAYCWLGQGQTLIYNKDGRGLVVGTADGEILSEIEIEFGLEDDIDTVKSSSNGKYFAASTGDQVCIYSWSGGQAELVDTIPGSYNFRWCKVAPPTLSLPGTERAGVRDREDRGLVDKYPALTAWFGFANALRFGDLDSAFEHLCDGDGGGRFEKIDFKGLPLSSIGGGSPDLIDLGDIVGDFNKNLAVIAIRSGFMPEFGEVTKDQADMFVIQGVWQLYSITMFSSYHRDLRIHGLDYEYSPLTLDSLKRPYEFHFHRINGQWHYLPSGW